MSLPINENVFSFVGKLKTMTQAKASAYVKAGGGSVTSGITKRTTVVVVAEGSEVESREGVTEWTETTFLDSIGLDEDGNPKQKAKKATAKGKGKAVAKVKKEQVEEKPAKKTAASKKVKQEIVKDEEIEEEIPAKKGKKRAKKDVDTKDEPAQKKVKTEANTSGGTAERRSARKPDRFLTSRDAFEIVDDFTADLMQSNIGDNNNKFYVIQLLQSMKDKSYHVFNRWGRLGEPGQQKLFPFGANYDGAVAFFEKKFYDKTRNHWESRQAFSKQPGKYQLVELDTTETGDGDEGGMGKLSAAQIQKGQYVLEQLKLALENKNSGSQIALLSGEYYSFIPTVAGRQRPPPLNTKKLIEEKEALLDFWLRMGFDDMEEQDGLAPIEGIMDIPLPATLHAAASNITQAGAIKQCQQRGTELAKSKAGSPTKSMDKELYGSIVLYTGNWIYSALNSALRSENRMAIRKYFNYLRIFLEAMERMPQQEQMLWRGISVDLFDSYEEGKVITWWGVSSCTSDENVARNFMNSCGGSCTLLRVRCKTAMDISVLSMYPSEKECLLAPGTQLKVLKRVRNGRISEIDVEEVGRAI